MALEISAFMIRDARHSHGTILYKHGIPAKVIQERLGRANISTTLSHVVPGMQEAAAAAFDDILQSKENKLDKELREIVRN